MWLGLVLVSVALLSPAHAQSAASVYEEGRVEAIDVRIENPSPDRALNDRVRDRVRVGLGLFPGDPFSRATAEFNLARARRAAPVASTRLMTAPGPTGGILVTILVQLAPTVAGTEARGALITGRAADLPVLYDRAGTFLRMRLESIGMYYATTTPGTASPDLS